MTQIFISYSRKDLDFVEHLAKDLRRAGFEVWYDISNLVVGANWGKEIQAALRNSQYLVVVLSPHSVESEWVEREYLYASNNKLKIIPILYRDCELPLWSLNIHHINMTSGNYERALEDVLRVLGKTAGATPAQTMPPQADGRSLGEKLAEESQSRRVVPPALAPARKGSAGKPVTLARKGAGRWLAIVAGILVVLVGGGYLLGRTVLPGILGVQPAAATQTSPATSIPLVAQPTRQPTTQPTNTPYYSWEQINDGGFEDRDSVIHIYPDPVDNQVLYVATRNSGLYKSRDGGENWQSIQNDLDRVLISQLLINPQDPKVLYVVTEDTGNIFKSNDGGQAWERIRPGEQANLRDWGLLVMDPDEPEHLFFGIQDKLYESRDGGRSWEITIREFPGGFQALAAGSADGQVLYAMVSEDYGSRFYISQDSGVTWSSPSWLDSFYRVLLVEDTANGGHVIYTRDQNDGRIKSSIDGGKTWRSYATPCNGLAIDPHGGLVASCENGIMRTRDGGETWEVVNNDTIGHADTVAVSPHTAKTMYAGWGGFSISTDGGISWRMDTVGSGLGNTRLELTADPYSDVLYAESEYGNLFRSRNGGHNWEKIYGGGFELAIGRDGELWRGKPDYFVKSPDQGDNWVTVGTPAQSPGEAYTISAHPRQNGLIYLIYQEPGKIYECTNGGVDCTEIPWQVPEGSNDPNSSLGGARLFFGSEEILYMAVSSPSRVVYSNDGGNNWQTCYEDANDFIQPNGGKNRMVVDPRSSLVTYLATVGRGVMRSSSSCGLWLSRNNGLGNMYVNSLVSDVFNPDILFAGTENGVHVTFDAGEHWNAINDGLERMGTVYSITVDDNGEVYASTPDGIFKLVR